MTDAVSKVFIVSFKEGSYRILSQTPQNAMRDFMRRVMVEQIGIEQLGQIGFVLEDGKEEDDKIPFRIAPAMFNLGKLDAKTYLQGLQENISADISMADAMEIAKKDRWLTEIRGDREVDPRFFKKAKRAEDGLVYTQDGSFGEFEFAPGTPDFVKSMPGIQEIIRNLRGADRAFYLLLISKDGDWFASKAIAPALNVANMTHIHITTLIARKWIERRTVEGIAQYRTNTRGTA